MENEKAPFEQRVQLNNQDIRFTVSYRKGSKNQSDYLSRHAKPIKRTSTKEPKETDEIYYLLYTLSLSRTVLAWQLLPRKLLVIRHTQSSMIWQRR